jgi:Zn-dependent oligopeptidase
MKKNNPKKYLKNKKNNKKQILKKNNHFTFTNIIMFLSILTFSLIPVIAIYSFIKK